MGGDRRRRQRRRRGQDPGRPGGQRLHQDQPGHRGGGAHPGERHKGGITAGIEQPPDQRGALSPAVDDERFHIAADSKSEGRVFGPADDEDGGRLRKGGGEMAAGVVAVELGSGLAGGGALVVGAEDPGR